MMEISGLKDEKKNKNKKKIKRVKNGV